MNNQETESKCQLLKYNNARKINNNNIASIYGVLHLTKTLQDKSVLILDDNLSQNEWKMGKFIQTFPSKDGFI
jgi:hypothetical protein